MLNDRKGALSFMHNTPHIFPTTSKCNMLAPVFPMLCKNTFHKVPPRHPLQILLLITAQTSESTTVIQALRPSKHFHNIFVLLISVMTLTGALSVGNGDCHQYRYTSSCREVVLSVWASPLPMTSAGDAFFRTHVQAAQRRRAGSTNTVSNNNNKREQAHIPTQGHF